MAATTLTAMPSVIYAGDTLLLENTLSDYRASDGWTLTYEFRAPSGTAISFSSVADSDGTSHYFNVTSASTQTWAPASYRGQAYVSNGTQVFTVWEGYLDVKADLSSQTSDYDSRSTAKKILDYIDAVALKVAQREVITATVEGISLQFRTMDELLRSRAYWQAVYDQEQKATGVDANPNIYVRFN